MIQEFQIQNFFSIRERQTLSFLPTNDDKMRSQYLYEVAEGVELPIHEIQACHFPRVA